MKKFGTKNNNDIPTLINLEGFLKAKKAKLEKREKNSSMILKNRMNRLYFNQIFRFDKSRNINLLDTRSRNLNSSINSNKASATRNSNSFLPEIKTYNRNIDIFEIPKLQRNSSVDKVTPKFVYKHEQAEKLIFKMKKYLGDFDSIELPSLQ